MTDFTHLRNELDALNSLRSELAGTVTSTMDPAEEMSLPGLTRELGLPPVVIRHLEKLGKIRARRTSRKRRARKRYHVKQVLEAVLVEAPKVPLARKRRASTRRQS